MRVRLSPALFVLVALLATCGALSSASARSAHPYIGKWSNGRGETLEITKDSLQFGEDDPVSYSDVTGVTDGNSFELHITEEGKVNGFSGKYLAVTCQGGKMEISVYRSHADLFHDENQQGEVNWFRD